jgi:hypothetical protein
MSMDRNGSTLGCQTVIENMRLRLILDWLGMPRHGCGKHLWQSLIRWHVANMEDHASLASHSLCSSVRGRLMQRHRCYDN